MLAFHEVFAKSVAMGGGRINIFCQMCVVLPSHDVTLFPGSVLEGFFLAFGNSSIEEHASAPRWLSLGPALSTVVASEMTGLSSLVAHIRRTASSDYYIKGHGRLDPHLLRFCIVGSLACGPAEALQASLLEDDRVCRHITYLEHLLSEEVRGGSCVSIRLRVEKARRCWTVPQDIWNTLDCPAPAASHVTAPPPAATAHMRVCVWAYFHMCSVAGNPKRTTRTGALSNIATAKPHTVGMPRVV